ncbi:unnamed protein product [Sphagnum balticum]
MGKMFAMQQQAGDGSGQQSGVGRVVSGDCGGVGYGLREISHILGIRGKVGTVLDKSDMKVWRSLVSSAWILAILLVFRNMEACGELLQQFTVAAAVRQVGGFFSVLSNLISLGFIFVVGLSTGFWWRVQKQKSTERLQLSPEVMLLEQACSSSSSGSNSGCSARVSLSPQRSSVKFASRVQQYSLKEIESMTNNFEKELGRGGQGIVYVATIPGETPIAAAVKKLQKNDALLVGNAQIPAQQTLEKEFWVELKTISRLHHGNLVSLLGYCVEGQQLFLIYELMSKGSLDKHLHKWDSGLPGAKFLDWRARMRVAIDVAEGLEYLHRHAHPTLVHRDIKSSNILFDDDMQAKIADFGFSKALIADKDSTISNRVCGTPGYVDPCYLKTGRAVDKNDVYSYGVLLLELITGRRALQRKVTLANWCKEFFTNDPSLMAVLLPKMVDSGIQQSEYSLEQLQSVVKIAKGCLDDNQERRSSMKEVVIALHKANCKDFSSSESSFEENNGALRILNNVPSVHGGSDPQSPTSFKKGTSYYEIKKNTIIVIVMLDDSKIAMRCKIWPTLNNFGLNKIEVTANGGFLWKKGLWWYNSRSSRVFTVDEHIKLIAEWHVTLRTSHYGLAPSDPRRSQGPFCVEYLALKDLDGKALVEYHGDHSPLECRNVRTLH